MPSELMDQRHIPSHCAPSVAFSNEIHMPPQRHIGFQKAESMPVPCGRDGLPLLFGNMSLASPPLEKSRSVNLNSAENFPSLQDLYIEKHKTKPRHEHPGEVAMTKELSVTSWEAANNDSGSQTTLLVQPASLNGTTHKFDLKRTPSENGFFASSLPPSSSKQFSLSTNKTFFVQSTNKVDSFAEEEPFDSLEIKEIEAQIIGNLLPDDEDLLSGVIDERECIAPQNYWNDADEDLFSSGGGLELDADQTTSNDMHSTMRNDVFKNRKWGCNNINRMDKSYDAYPSRTILVKNVPRNIEDTELNLLFQHYGDIRAIHTTCKTSGYIMVSYYDLRSACNAMTSLQNKLLKNTKLDIHFSLTKGNHVDSEGLLAVFNLDPSVLNEDVHQIFGAYGEIRLIRDHQTCRLVEFYDVRAAEAALHSLNMSDIAGKRIEISSGLPGGSGQSIMQHFPCEIKNIEANGCHPQGSLLRDSPSRCSVSGGTMLSNGLGNGSHQAFRAVSQSSISSFIENGYEGFGYGSSHYLSPVTGVAIAGSHHNQSGFSEHSHSLGHVNIGFDTIRNFHPHSLPEHHEALINGISYRSPNTISAMSINLHRHAEGVVHVPRVSSAGFAGLSFGCNEPVFGSLGEGRSTLQGHANQYLWNDSNSSHQQLQSPVMWQESLFMKKNLPAQSPSQLQGLARAHSHMLNTSVSLSQHHVGSAPTINHSLWDRRQTYTGDLAETSPFHPGSVESVGFSRSSTMHQMELGSPNIFPRVNGNFVEPLISSPQIGLPSPQKFHMFHGRNSVVTVPSAFDGPNDRARNRRGDASSNQVDNKKHFELDVDRIIRGEDNRTTLMIKNIPNKYTSKMLLTAIDENHRGTYDFIYLPIDFKNKCNVGYAFINMTEAQQIVPFYKSFNGKKWEKFNSEKVASLAYARIQGRSALIAHFQNSSLMNEDKRCRPILFHANGPNAGDQEPFPMGTNIRSRPGRSRAYGSEDNNLESPSNSTDGEDASISVDSLVPRKE